MSDSDDGFPWLLVALCVLAFVTGCSVGTKIMERRAIRHDAAHYDAKTGDFTWNNPEVEPK